MNTPFFVVGRPASNVAAVPVLPKYNQSPSCNITLRSAFLGHIRGGRSCIFLFTRDTALLGRRSIGTPVLASHLENDEPNQLQKSTPPAIKSSKRTVRAQKEKQIFGCNECGNEFQKWHGRCPICNEWNTLKEIAITRSSAAVERNRVAWGVRRGATTGSPAVPVRLSEVLTESFPRIEMESKEFSRVLGGGIVQGSVTLVGGDPGIGKSTLLLQLAGELATRGDPVLYVSGEESAQQIRLRAERLGITSGDLFLLSETNLEAIDEHVRAMRPALVIVDSIQTVYLDSIASSQGSLPQVRECAVRLMQTAKGINVPIFLVGHVNKSGDIAGPRVLEHIVDVVLYVEGDRYNTYRLLRSVKNRFGSTNDLGVFEMSEAGLVDVADPSQLFLSRGSDSDSDPDRALHPRSGSVVAVTMEGTRPLVLEIQSLASKCNGPIGRRLCHGIDRNRLYLLEAVLSKRLRIATHMHDLFVNVTGGLRVSEPALDLAVCVAIVSSLRDIPVRIDTVVIGEVGLGGELRSVRHLEKRMMEASKLGFRRCVVPKPSGRAPLPSVGGCIQAVPCLTLAEAVSAALDPMLSVETTDRISEQDILEQEEPGLPLEDASRAAEEEWLQQSEQDILEQSEQDILEEEESQFGVGASDEFPSGGSRVEVAGKAAEEEWLQQSEQDILEPSEQDILEEEESQFEVGVSPGPTEDAGSSDERRRTMKAFLENELRQRDFF